MARVNTLYLPALTEELRRRLSSLKKLLTWTNQIILIDNTRKEVPVLEIDKDLLKRSTVKTLLGEILLLPPSQLKDPQLKVELESLKKQIQLRGRIYQKFFTWLNTTVASDVQRIKVQEIPDSFIANRFISDLIGIKAVDKDSKVNLARPLSVTLVEPDEPVRISGPVVELRERVLRAKERAKPVAVEPSLEPTVNPPPAQEPNFGEAPDIPVREEPTVKEDKPVTDESKPLGKIDSVKQAAYHIDDNEYFNALFIEQAYRATQNIPNLEDEFKSAYKHELVRQYAFLKHLFQRNKDIVPVKGYSTKNFVNKADLYQRMNLLMQGDTLNERFLPTHLINAAQEARVLNTDLQDLPIHLPVTNFPEFQYTWSQDYTKCLSAIRSETVYEEPQIEQSLIDGVKENFRKLAEGNRKTNSYEYAAEARNRELVLEAYMKRFGEAPPLRASKIADKRAKIFGAKNAQDLYERLCAKDDKHILPHMVLIAASRQQGFMDLMKPYDGFDKVLEKKQEAAASCTVVAKTTLPGKTNADLQKLPDSTGVVTSAHQPTDINWRESERRLNEFKILQEAFDNLLRIPEQEFFTFSEIHLQEIYRKHFLYSYVFSPRELDLQNQRAQELGYKNSNEVKNYLKALPGHRFIADEVVLKLQNNGAVQAMPPECLVSTPNTYTPKILKYFKAGLTRFIDGFTLAQHQLITTKIQPFAIDEAAFESYFGEVVNHFELKNSEDEEHFLNENDSRKAILKAYFMRFGQSALDDTSSQANKRAQVFGFKNHDDLVEVLTKSDRIVPPEATFIASAYSGSVIPPGYNCVVALHFTTSGGVTLQLVA